MYYFQEETFQTIELPNLFYSTNIPNKDPTFELTYKKASLILKQSNKPTLSLKILKAGNVLKFDILIYKDKYKLNLL